MKELDGLSCCGTPKHLGDGRRSFEVPQDDEHEEIDRNTVRMKREKAQSIRRTVGRLRASHEAMRAAQAVEYRAPVDRPTARCLRCGREIDVMPLDLDFVPEALTCPRCGEEVRVPAYVRGVLVRAPERQYVMPWDYARTLPPPGQLVVVDATDYSAPKAVTLLLATCLATVLVMVIWTLLHVG